MPVTMEATKVPKIANVTMAPKLEKNGFCKIKNPYQRLSYTNSNKEAKMKGLGVRQLVINKRFVFSAFRFLANLLREVAIIPVNNVT